MISIDEIVEFYMSCPDAAVLSLLALIFVYVWGRISPYSLFIAAVVVFVLVTKLIAIIPVAIAVAWIVGVSKFNEANNDERR